MVNTCSIGGQAAVIFLDLGSHDTFANVANWYEAIVRVCGNVPIVVVRALLTDFHPASNQKNLNTCPLHSLGESAGGRQVRPCREDGGARDRRPVR
jgi:hypothetical protein